MGKAVLDDQLSGPYFPGVVICRPQPLGFQDSHRRDRPEVGVGGRRDGAPRTDRLGGREHRTRDARHSALLSLSLRLAGAVGSSTSAAEELRGTAWHSSATTRLPEATRDLPPPVLRSPRGPAIPVHQVCLPARIGFETLGGLGLAATPRRISLLVEADGQVKSGLRVERVNPNCREAVRLGLRPVAAREINECPAHQGVGGVRVQPDALPGGLLGRVKLFRGGGCCRKLGEPAAVESGARSAALAAARNRSAASSRPPSDVQRAPHASASPGHRSSDLRRLPRANGRKSLTPGSSFSCRLSREPGQRDPEVAVEFLRRGR